MLRDGAEACEFLFSQAQTGARGLPQLILLDLKLPKISGLEVLEQVRANDATRSDPTVILTSSKQEEDLLEGYRLGVNSYVRKPVDFNEFVEAVRQVGLYWLVLNEPPPAMGGRLVACRASGALRRRFARRCRAQRSGAATPRIRVAKAREWTSDEAARVALSEQWDLILCDYSMPAF